MSDSDLDLYSLGGQIQPYSPSQPLAPTPADSWGDTPDYLTEHSLIPSSGDLPAHVEQNLAQITGIFYSDFSALGHPLKHIEACAQWFKKSLANPPTNMPTKRHQYNLFQMAHDPIAQHFANFAASIGISQQMMETIIYWLQELEKRLDQVAHGNGDHAQLPRTAPNSNGQLDVDSLSDAAYDRLVVVNDQAKARTQASLQRRWGQAYKQNMAAAQELLANLPAADQAYLSQYNPKTWVSGLNEEQTILGLHSMAIGSNSLPNGAAIQSEIASIENVMRTNRKAYNSDLRLQARLRTLYDMRG